MCWGFSCCCPLWLFSSFSLELWLASVSICRDLSLFFLSFPSSQSLVCLLSLYCLLRSPLSTGLNCRTVWQFGRKRMLVVVDVLFGLWTLWERELYLSESEDSVCDWNAWTLLLCCYGHGQSRAFFIRRQQQQQQRFVCLPSLSLSLSVSSSTPWQWFIRRRRHWRTQKKITASTEPPPPHCLLSSNCSEQCSARLDSNSIKTQQEPVNLGTTAAESPLNWKTMKSCCSRSNVCLSVCPSSFFFFREFFPLPTAARTTTMATTRRTIDWTAGHHSILCALLCH